MAKTFLTTKDGERHSLSEAERKHIEETKPGQFENGVALKAHLSKRPGGISAAVLGFCRQYPAPASQTV